jgi:thiopeptide-type bacteriocin biosynthesis protein
LPDWDAALNTWRQRLHAPAAVVLCEAEQRLPLDLDQPGHRALLRARLKHARPVELREAPTPTDLTWIGRAHEILMPLHRAGPQITGRQPQAAARPQTVARDTGHLPGHSPWLQVQIFGHPERQNEILTEHLPRLFDGWQDSTVWWFRRHRQMTHPDAEQHLDLFVHLPSPDRYGAAATRVGGWAADLRDLGLVPHIRLATYHPEPGRYGHGPAMDAAHKAFAADSAAALTQIELATGTGTPPQAVTAASLVDLAASYTDTPAHGLQWLIDHIPQAHGMLDRSLRDTTLRLADPADDWATLRAQPGGANVIAAWQRRRTALPAYRTQLAQQRDPHPVLRSLLHMHHIRALGVDPDRERVSHRLARAVALRQTAHQRSEPQ